MSDYLQLLLLCLALPLVLSIFPPLRLFRRTGALIKTILLVLLIYGGWDVFATLRGHWRFDPAAVGTFSVANLPLEEALFFVVIPFCCIFSWEVVKFLTGRK